MLVTLSGIFFFFFFFFFFARNDIVMIMSACVISLSMISVETLFGYSDLVHNL